MTLAKGTPTIIRGSDFMFSTIYEGNGGGQRVGKFIPYTDNGTIAKSCIFNKGDSPRLNRSASGTGTSRRKYTLSVWAKPSVSSSASDERYMIAAGPYGNSDGLTFDDDRTLKYWINGRTNGDFKTNRTFEDSSKFYHILISVDTTQSTASDRVKIYVDGDQQTSFSLETYPSQNYDGNWGSTASTNIGSSNSPNRYYNGYLAEVNYVDGTAYGPDTFGLTDTSTGRWIPKSLTGISYGTNGFRLEFANSAGQTIGDDTSGNGNDLTVTNLAATDITTDSPTQNHATFDPNRNGGDWTLSEGNLKIVGTPSTGAGRICLSGMNVPNSNKIYWEVEVDVNNDSPRYIGIFRDTVSLTAGSSTEDMRFIATRNGGTHDGKVWDGNSSSSQLTTTTSGDIIQFARDGENLWIGKNNTWLNSGNPSTGANPLFTNIDTNSNWKIGVYSVSTGLPGGTSHTFIMNAGQRTFSYTPPTDFVALQQDNFPDEGKGVPDWVWIKNRDATDAHQIYNSTRGPQKDLNISTVQESTTTDGLQKFLKGGFAIEDDVSINTSGESYVSWNWVCNGGTTSTNDQGSIDSTTQVNSTAGFSIIQHTGNGTNGATIGHGLSQAPTFLITKNTSTNNRDWMVWHHKLTDGSYFIDLNQSEAQIQSTSYTNSTAPSSTVITLGTSAIINGNGESYITFAFHDVPGFSKFGSYTGNANSSGPFINLGFKPAWLMIKNISRSVDWIIIDNKRDPFNDGVSKLLKPNETDAESEANNKGIDLLSNGFKIRQSSSNAFNASSETHVYMAFAEHPFIGNGTNPATAR